MRIVQRPITLLEILTVIAIIALFAGVIGFNVNKAMVDQRFRNEVSMIVDELRLAQDLMQILDTDVHVKFKEAKDVKGILYWIEVETTLPSGVQTEINRKRSPLKTIQGVFFKDLLLDTTTPGEIDVKFLSKGAVMSKGMMRLATSDSENPSSNVLQNYICLAGYPRPIYSRDSKEAAEGDCDEAKNVEFYQQLTQDTFGKLPEKVKQLTEPSQEPSKDSADKAAPAVEKAAQDKGSAPASSPNQGK